MHACTVLLGGCCKLAHAARFLGPLSAVRLRTLVWGLCPPPWQGLPDVLLASCQARVLLGVAWCCCCSRLCLSTCR